MIGLSASGLIVRLTLSLKRHAFMISFLVGSIVDKSAPMLVLNVNGVGYEVQASLNTFAALPAIGSDIKLLIHFVVREDAQLLYGFAESSERQLFRSLIKVNGVGPKLAITILSGIDAVSFSRCILANDVASLIRLPGIGKKTAERLIVEMKDRLQEWHSEDVLSNGELLDVDGRTTDGSAVSRSKMLADAETALVSLGYKPVEASKALARLDLSAMSSSEDAIRAALKAMVSG